MKNSIGSVVSGILTYKKNPHCFICFEDETCCIKTSGTCNVAQTRLVVLYYVCIQFCILSNSFRYCSLKDIIWNKLEKCLMMILNYQGRGSMSCANNLLGLVLVWCIYGNECTALLFLPFVLYIINKGKLK